MKLIFLLMIKIIRSKKNLNILVHLIIIIIVIVGVSIFRDFLILKLQNAH
jgi:hypothetical protein